ncbi:MAG: HpcH/HpaI aldolase family protein [Armatimonadota bacterium]
MKRNETLHRIRNGKTAFGFTLVLGSPVIAEQAAQGGFDWIWMDAQHGYWSDEQLLSALQVISATEATPIVRSGSNEFYRIGRVLDAGALGVIVPMVNSAEEAERAVEAAYYPPLGGRSRGGARLALLGDDYFEASTEEILLAVMIETVEALDNLEDIAAVKGIDCLFLGPSDLCASMETEYGSPEHEAAIVQVLKAAQNAGVVPGFPCGDPEDALRRAEQGFKLVTCYSDNGSMRAGLKRVQDALGG